LGICARDAGHQSIVIDICPVRRLVEAFVASPRGRGQSRILRYSLGTPPVSRVNCNAIGQREPIVQGRLRLALRIRAAAEGRCGTGRIGVDTLSVAVEILAQPAKPEQAATMRLI
jgi:hypothetical protein